MEVATREEMSGMSKEFTGKNDYGLVILSW